VSTIDLNADVGEGHDDLPIFELVSSVSVACGAHAGDEATMDRSIAEAARLGLAAGAHPGYPDRAGHGREAMDMSARDLRRSLVEQIRLLAEIAGRHGVRLTHVKPHGALYNRGADDTSVASVVAEAVMEADDRLRLVGLAGSALLAAAAAARIGAVAEAFADRRYRADGRLVPRGDPRALITDPDEASAQALGLATGVPIETADGRSIVVDARTICVHADTPGAVEIARSIRRTLERAGVDVRAVGDD
jgi:UPF0271 protein